MKPFIHTTGGIDWYCERGGHGPSLVLVPSGEGDCSSFRRTAEALSGNFDVLTFDTPGFSRSGSPNDPTEISPYTLAKQIVGLTESLGIEHAVYYGCSSGGIAVLDLLANHQDVIVGGIVHEPAIIENAASSEPHPLVAVLSRSDEEVRSACEQYFSNVLNEDRDAWLGLGADYHQRLATNYLTWVRQYIAKIDVALQPRKDGLASCPLTWTIGSYSFSGRTLANVRFAVQSGIDVGLLPCRHFPQVSIPLVLSDHILAVASSYLSKRTLSAG